MTNRNCNVPKMFIAVFMSVELTLSRDRRLTIKGTDSAITETASSLGD